MTKKKQAKGPLSKTNKKHATETKRKKKKATEGHPTHHSWFGRAKHIVKNKMKQEIRRVSHSPFSLGEHNTSFNNTGRKHSARSFRERDKHTRTKKDTERQRHSKQSMRTARREREGKGEEEGEGGRGKGRHNCGHT